MLKKICVGSFLESTLKFVGPTDLFVSTFRIGYYTEPTRKVVGVIDKCLCAHFSSQFLYITDVKDEVGPTDATVLNKFIDCGPHSPFFRVDSFIELM